MLLNKIFYPLKPAIPRTLQIFIRRGIARYQRRKYADVWPIDHNSGDPPKNWPGWPEDKKFALVLSHDVDTRKGYDNVLKLAELEEEMGFRSQFNFVPERYGKIEIRLLYKLRSRGFGIGVHGLKHDGKLFRSKKVFNERAPRINSYLHEWSSKGFSTPSMIRNHDWMPRLDIDYCLSTFDTDPFEMQSNGVSTIFPYWVRNGSTSQKFLELPYTLAQDFTLFILLGENNIEKWKQKLDWIYIKGGMAQLISHPDYMNFNGSIYKGEEYPVSFYIGFLKYVQSIYSSRYWLALPSQVHSFLLNVNGASRVE